MEYYLDVISVLQIWNYGIHHSNVHTDYGNWNAEYPFHIKEKLYKMKISIVQPLLSL